MSFQTVDSQLKQMGWDWAHPRITAYINDFSAIHNITFSPATLPDRAYKKISAFLRIYKRINQLLVASESAWNEPAIIDYFRRQSVRDISGNPTNRLKLDKWIALEEMAIELYCPF